MDKFGEKLRTLRRQHGMTLKELATALELTAHSHISELETGKSKPTSDLVIKIARLFKVSTDQLLLDEVELK